MLTDPIIPPAPLADAAVEHLRLAEEQLADADARLTRAEGARHLDPVGYASAQAAAAAAHAGLAAALVLMELRDHMRTGQTALDLYLNSDAWDTAVAGLRTAQLVPAPEPTLRHAAPEPLRYAARLAQRHPGTRIALVAADANIGASVLIAGAQGLLALLDRADGPVWNPASRELTLANGSRFTVYSAEQPARLRGSQHHYGIAYDRASWPAAEAEEAWQNLRLGARLRGAPEEGMRIGEITVGTTFPIAG